MGESSQMDAAQTARTNAKLQLWRIIAVATVAAAFYFVLLPISLMLTAPY
jgi:hypothetical protein